MEARKTVISIRPPKSNSNEFMVQVKKRVKSLLPGLNLQSNRNYSLSSKKSQFLGKNHRLSQLLSKSILFFIKINNIRKI